MPRHLTNKAMRNLLAALLLIPALVPPIGVQRTSKSIQSKPLETCLHMKSRHGLVGYEKGGRCSLEHFRLTKGRTDPREFLWKHWHSKIKGMAEASVGRVDRGTVQVLYMIQPDAQGHWVIDVEMDRPMDPPCVAFHTDSLVRVPIQNPNEDYPSQTIGLEPSEELSSTRLVDSDVVDAKLYRTGLVQQN